MEVYGRPRNVRVHVLDPVRWCRKRLSSPFLNGDSAATLVGEAIDVGEAVAGRDNSMVV